MSGALEQSSRLGWTGWRLSWRVVNLWEVPAQRLLAAGAVGLIPWVPLTHFDGPPEPILQECRRRIDTQASEAERANLLAVTQVLGRLRYDLPTLAALFGEKQGMIESPLIQELLEDREVIQASPAHRQMLAEDRQQAILRILRARFQTVPDDLTSALQAVSRPEDLNALIEWGALCPSLEAFRTRLPAAK